MSKIKDAVAKLYDCAPWRKFKAFVLGLNPQCQRLIGDEQCHALATVVHHLISPRVNMSLFLDWRNVVCVCAPHHPGGRAGEPLDTPATYAITQGMLGDTCNPNETIKRLRGGV